MQLTKRINYCQLYLSLYTLCLGFDEGIVLRKHNVQGGPLYAMVAGISHDIIFDMHHMRCKGILHIFGHVVCLLLLYGMLFQNYRNLNLGYFNVRND